MYILIRILRLIANHYYYENEKHLISSPMSNCCYYKNEKYLILEYHKKVRV